jgi:hypothetical protein
VAARVVEQVPSGAESAIWLLPNVHGPHVGAEFRMDDCGIDRVNEHEYAQTGIPIRHEYALLSACE